VMTEKMLTYSLGRGVTVADMPTVRGIVKQSDARPSGKDNFRFSDLILGIVESAPFQMKVKHSQASTQLSAQGGQSK